MAKETFVERVFEKGHPCTKVEIFNCFYGHGSEQHDDGKPSSPMVRAKAYIGRHVPYRLRQQGKAELVLINDEPHLKLTPEGVHWLWHGAKRYVKNHPHRAFEIEMMPRHWRRMLKTVAK